MSLRGEYIKEWRVWYNAFNKAKKDDVEVYEPWLNFYNWFDDLGPRPGDGYQFCRDDWEGPWTPDNAGWRSMPCGRQRAYYGYYKVRTLGKD
jgi:hypothetical protein